MSRRPTFNRTQVLDAALTLFWEQGYLGTSMLHLEKATGLKPGSLYNSFGSKQSLFLEVVGYYIEGVVGERIASMLNHPDPIQGIEDFFRTAYDEVPSADLHGCLLTNTATESCIADDKIRAAVQTGTQTIEAAFLVMLERAQNEHRIPPAANLAELALHLTSCFQGLEVMARLHRDKAQLNLLTGMALSAIELC